MCWLAVPAVLVLAAGVQPRTGRAAGPAARMMTAPDSAGAATAYADPTGDSGTAPDITSVVVSRDASDRIRFRVNVVRLAVPSSGRVMIAIDSDHNAATGYGGFDHMLMTDLASNDLVDARWNGAGFAPGHPSTATVSSDATGVSFSVDAGELGTTTGFRFFARTVAGSQVAAGHYDDAPDTGAWSYQPDGPTALTLTAENPTTSKARAGKRFVALINVVRSDGEQAEVTYGDVSCSAIVAGRLLPATAIPTYAPAAGCSWHLPKHSRGRTVHAAVTVTLDGASTSHTFSATIR